MKDYLGIRDIGPYQASGDALFGIAQSEHEFTRIKVAQGMA